MAKKEQIRLSQLMNKCVKAIQPTYYFPLIIFFSSSLVFFFFNCDFTILPLLSAFKYSIDRNHIFLLCNGILVIIVKSSSSSSSSSSSAQSFPPQVSKVAKSNDDITPNDQQIDQENLACHDQSNVQHTIPDDHDENSTCLHVEEGCVSDHDEQENDDDDDDDDDQELNKRCEDFIRKVKMGLIYETRKDPGLPTFC